jgi:hypothetical protein
MSTSIPSDDMSTSLGSDPDIYRLLDNIQTILPAITPALIKMMAWNAIEEFSLRSTYFREQVQWSMPIGVAEVDFNPFSSDMSVCWVLNQCGLYKWRVRSPATLVDLYQPTTARTGEALLALKPRSFDSNLPPGFWSTWFETILDGTLFRLYGQPGKPWSSPQLAQYHGTRFRQGMSRARDIVNRGGSGQAPSWYFPLFARGRRKN